MQPVKLNACEVHAVWSSEKWSVKSCTWGRSNSMDWYLLGGPQMEIGRKRSHEGAGTLLLMRQQFILAVRKASNILEHIESTVSELWDPLHLVWVKPHMKSHVQFYTPCRDKDRLESSRESHRQRRVQSICAMRIGWESWDWRREGWRDFYHCLNTWLEWKEVKEIEPDPSHWHTGTGQKELGTNIRNNNNKKPMKFHLNTGEHL